MLEHEGRKLGGVGGGGGGFAMLLTVRKLN